MRPDDFYVVANELAAYPGEIESFVRSAVSRFYYGAYHETHDYLTARGHHDLHVTPTGVRGSEHDGVQQWLAHENEDAGDALDELRQRRTWADYHLSRDGTPHEIDEVRHRLRMVRRYLGLE